MTRQSFVQKSDFWSNRFGWLAPVGVITIEAILPHFVPANSPFFVVTSITLDGLIGLYYLYSGVKKFRLRQERQSHARWYTQPSILVAIGIFFLIFVALLLQAPGHSTLDVTLWMLVLLPTWICWLAALVFLVRDRRTPKVM